MHVCVYEMAIIINLTSLLYEDDSYSQLHTTRQVAV